MKVGTENQKPFSILKTVNETGFQIGCGLKSLGRAVAAIWDAVPESYPISSDEDLKKMTGKPGNFVVFNGRMIRVKQSKKTDGNLSPQDV